MQLQFSKITFFRIKSSMETPNGTLKSCTQPTPYIASRRWRHSATLSGLAIGLGLLGWFCFACDQGPRPASPEEEAYFAAVREYRKARDRYFAHSKNSPLLPGDKENFKGLNYFPIDPALRFTLPMHRFEQPDTIWIMTTDGVDRPALRLGYFSFTIDGKPQRLHVYRFLDVTNSEERHLFIPFLDQTAGKETYGGGRYLDLEENESDLYELDFNYAYNPSCAYGRKEYRCPLPPSENTLSVAIGAGEKAWHK